MSDGWLTGGGATGELIRSLDWRASPLGDPAGWPQSLRSVVGLLLGSKFPMFVAWGSELGFLYNDAYADILGEKHPQAMGRRFPEIWGEIWDDISPLVQGALAGEASFSEDLPLVMNRHGYDERTSFTFSYSPVRDERGQVAGMFCAVVETTQRVRTQRAQAFVAEFDEALRDIETADGIFDAGARLIARHLGADRVHWASVDLSADTFQVKHEWTSGGAPSLMGVHHLSDFGAALIDEMAQGRTVAVTDALRDAPASPPAVKAEFDTAVRGILAAPLIRGGRWQTALCAHTLAPRHWRDDEREFLRDVAERAWARAQRAQAEARVRESEARFRALANATSDAVYRMSADWSQMILLDSRGGLPDAAKPRFAWMDDYLFVEDQPDIRRAIDTAIQAKSVFQMEHRVRQPDGSVGWTFSRAVPLLDEAGEVVEWFGTASDVSQAHAGRRALEETAQRLQLATEAAEVGFWDLDVETGVLIWPERVKEMFGIAPEAPISMDDFYTGLHPDDRGATAAAFAAAMDPQQRALYDVEYRTVGVRDGQIRWVAAKGRGLFDGKGRCVRVLGTAIDITVRKAAEEHLRLMVNELNHRVKNSLATVQAIAAQTLRRGEIPELVREALVARLVALAEAHDVLTDQRWSGADLREIAEQAAAPYADVQGAAPFHLDGPDVRLPPKTAIALALAFHELATNAAKYGALSVPEGQVQLTWDIVARETASRLHLVWRERGGPAVSRPPKSGFGTRLIERGLASELQGQVRLEFAPTGVVCSMEAALPQSGAEVAAGELAFIGAPSKEGALAPP